MSLLTVFPEIFPGPETWCYGMGIVPDTPTLIVPRTAFIEYVVLTNTQINSTPIVTVRITDNSTNANGSPCQIIPSIALGPNSFLVIDLKGCIANGGIIWSASVPNVVHASIRGAY
jgi:hypothetical protein